MEYNSVVLMNSSLRFGTKIWIIRSFTLAMTWTVEFTQEDCFSEYVILTVLVCYSHANCYNPGHQFSYVQSLSCAHSLRPRELQHTRLPCPSPIPGVHPNPSTLSRWCHPTISSSIIPFSFCPQSFPVSGSFQMSQLFTSGGQSTGVSASTSVLPMNTQDWSPLGWTAWISLQSKGLSRVFSNTTVQKHQFFGTQLSL